MILEQDKDTIAAVSTAPGSGGIAVVRVSGQRATALTRPLVEFLPESPESHRLYFGTLKDPSSGDPVDEVLVAYFAKGKSFTGEEVIEISCHGGDWLAKEVVRLLLEQGARPARRGEFTYRAFMNGRVDLVQAEGVLDLIQSQSKGAARAAVRQLKGLLSRKLEEILDLVTWSAAHLEANIDFAQEDIEVASNATLVERLRLAQVGVSELLRTEPQRRLWNEGFHVALLGLPNVGKSSLLNKLVGEDRAIVTEIAGTTRDLVEGFLDINGVRVRVTDSAGLRETNETVERLGIEKSRRLAIDADLIFFVLDGKDLGAASREFGALDDAAKAKVVFVRNKSDLGVEGLALELTGILGHEFRADTDRVILASAQTGEGLETLLRTIGDCIKEQSVEDSPVIIKARHADGLRRIAASLEKAIGLIESHASPEFAAFELQEAVVGLHEILGRRFDDQVMDRVFNEFCLGK